MVARGAAGDPWLVDSLLAGEDRPRPPLAEVVADLRALLALVIDEMGREAGDEVDVEARRLVSAAVAGPRGRHRPVTGRARRPALDAALAALVGGQAAPG